MNKPLDGLRILDLTQFLAGSYCTMILAGLGAEVIKIEQPVVGDPARNNPPYAGINGISISRQSDEDISLSILKRCRNKKGITLNIRSEEGKQLFAELLKTADIVIENFRPGTMGKLGLSYSFMSGINPSIIYCSLTGFGSISAYSKLPAFDIVIQAIAGVMSTNGYPNGPPTKTGIAISDLAGGLFSCIGILAAVEYRNKTGKGQELTVSMLESVLTFLLDEAPDFWYSQGMPLRSGNRLTRLTPFNAYKAKDGYFVIASGSNQHWIKIINAMEREELLKDTRYLDLSDRVNKADEVDAIINSWARNITVSAALKALEAQGVPCAAVREIPEVVSDPHFISDEAVIPIYHPKVGRIDGAKAASLPIQYSLSSAGFDRPAPVLGQDNDTIYGSILGLDAERIQELRNKGVI